MRAGDNILALRLTVTESTEGLLDPLKLTGDFALATRDDGSHTVVAPRRRVQPALWTDQGYPFYSGRAAYRRHFRLPAGYEGCRLFLDPQVRDDVVEVLVNGQSAGVRLWPPYEVEITDWVRPGENTLELRVANTLINLLEGVQRPSGLAGAPVLRPERRFVFALD